MTGTCCLPLPLPSRWVRDLSKSVVLKVKGEARAGASSQFATGYTLRFPSVVDVRWDKV